MSTHVELLTLCHTNSQIILITKRCVRVSLDHVMKKWLKQNIRTSWCYPRYLIRSTLLKLCVPKKSKNKIYKMKHQEKPTKLFNMHEHRIKCLSYILFFFLVFMSLLYLIIYYIVPLAVFCYDGWILCLPSDVLLGDMIISVSNYHTL